MKLIVMIPCLNEEKTIKDVILSIPSDMETINQIDILIVNDGSTDNSARIARENGAIVVSHPTNMGVGRAFQTGLEYAIHHKYDIMLNIDADGQFDTNDIPKLVAPIISHKADFVTASRFLKENPIENMSKIKLWGNKRMSGLINRLTQKVFTDVSCGFRAYSREAMLHLNLQGQFTYTQETFLNLVFKNLRIVEVPVNVKYFADRKSRVAGSILKYTVNTLKIILRTFRDYQPIKFFWWIGAGFLMLSSFFIVFLLGWYFLNGRFSPHIWSGFVGGTFFFIALIFFVAGLITDMLTRVRNNQENILYLLRKKQ